jgi:uncharacterized membrane protein
VKTEESKSQRLPALDLARGIAVWVMAIDHASKVFNSSRINTDSALRWTPGSALPLDQFLTRWVTHICAPLFVALAGTALALSSERRLRRGDSPAEVDRHLRIRGVVLLVLEVVWMSPAALRPGGILLQVLFVIGTSIIAMSWLRRLSDRMLLLVALGIMVLGEAAADGLAALHVDGTVPAAIFLISGRFAGGKFVVAYPFFQWLGVMMLGWVFGRALLRWREAGADVTRTAARVLAIAGVVGLTVFGVLRGVDGYGNMHMHRDSGALLQWMHVSKYPPSLTFIGLELGLAALLVSGLFVYTAARPNVRGPLFEYGQTALFFYVTHIHVMALVALAFGWTHAFGVRAAYLGALGIVIALYPAVRWYRGYKAAHPNTWTQYI